MYLLLLESQAFIGYFSKKALFFTMLKAANWKRKDNIKFGLFLTEDCL